MLLGRQVRDVIVRLIRQGRDNHLFAVHVSTVRIKKQRITIGDAMRFLAGETTTKQMAANLQPVIQYGPKRNHFLLFHCFQPDTLHNVMGRFYLEAFTASGSELLKYHSVSENSCSFADGAKPAVW